MTLSVGPGARVLRIGEGRLWLTSPGTADETSTDVWMLPGDSIELPDGLAVVLEAWPSARFELLVPPTACRSARAASTILSRASAWLARLLHEPARPALAPLRHGAS